MVKKMILTYIARIIVICFLCLFFSDIDIIIVVSLILTNIIEYILLYKIMCKKNVKFKIIKCNYIIMADFIIWTFTSLFIFFSNETDGFLGSLAYWSDIFLQLCTFIFCVVCIIINSIVHFVVHITEDE